MPDQYHTQEEKSNTTLPHTHRPRAHTSGSTISRPPWPGTGEAGGSRPQPLSSQLRRPQPPPLHTTVVVVDPGRPPRPPVKSAPAMAAAVVALLRPPSPTHHFAPPLRAPGSGRDDARSSGYSHRRRGGRPARDESPWGARTLRPPRSAGEEGEGHTAAFPTGPGGPLRRRRGRTERKGGAAVANPSRPRRPAREGCGRVFLFFLPSLHACA
jgi:hypothetical protein